MRAFLVVRGQNLLRAGLVLGATLIGVTFITLRRRSRAVQRAPPPVYPSTGTRRIVLLGDSLGWMAANGIPAGHSVVTSVPDVTEFRSMPLESWKEWFSPAVRAILDALPSDQFAVFYQSDRQSDDMRVRVLARVLVSSRACS